jgi:16S rRNA (adenine1518-N6/adenine1519-N6)-dimethyltransferase
MLRASLKSLIPDPGPLLEAAGVAPTARAEEIDVAGFCRLARSYQALGAPPVTSQAPLSGSRGTG